MSDKDPQAMTGMLTAILQPWHDSVDDPAKVQQEVLHRLLKGYAQTDYGAQHGAAHIETIADYRRAFPVATYEDYKPVIERVMAGEVSLLLSEEPVGWAITRGTTEGESKFIPMTPTDLMMRISAGLISTSATLLLSPVVRITFGFVGEDWDCQNADLWTRFLNSWTTDSH